MILLKKFSLFLTISLICLVLCSCGVQTTAPDGGEVQEKIQIDETDKTVLETVRDEILDELAIEDAMFIETENLNSLYGIEEGVIKSSGCFVTMSGTFPHEIIMVEAVDNNAVDTIVTSLEKKLSEVLIQSKSYDAKNYELAQQCKVYTKGNYVTLFLSPDHAKMQTILDKYI